MCLRICQRNIPHPHPNAATLPHGTATCLERGCFGPLVPRLQLELLGQCLCDGHLLAQLHGKTCSWPAPASERVLPGRPHLIDEVAGDGIHQLATGLAGEGQGLLACGAVQMVSWQSGPAAPCGVSGYLSHPR